jgi:hypothetical protein
VNRKNKIFIQTDAKKTGFYIEIQKIFNSLVSNTTPDKILGEKGSKGLYINIFQ